MIDLRKSVRLGLYRLYEIVLAFFSRFEVGFRNYTFNQQTNVSISEQAYLARSVKIQINPDGFQSGGNVQISSGARISDGVILAPWGGSIAIGEKVYIGPYSVLYGAGGLKIGRNSLIAAQVGIFASNHGFDQLDIPIRNQPLTLKGINIGEDVWIGSGVKVLDGVTIGRGCVIGAGSVVASSIEDYAIAVGVPCRVIGRRN